MNLIKVNTVSPHTDSINKIYTWGCDGKLVFVKYSEENEREIPYAVFEDESENQAYQPIIISETEKIEKGNYCFWNSKVYKCIKKEIIFGTPQITLDPDIEITESEAKKVLALPEDFPRSIILDIIDGKLKNGDCVFIECEAIEIPSPDDIKYKTGYGLYVIKLDSDNHINLIGSERRNLYGWREKADYILRKHLAKKLQDGKSSSNDRTDAIIDAMMEHSLVSISDNANRFVLTRLNRELQDNKETLGAKLRNALSPHYGLPSAVLKLRDHPEILKIVEDMAEQAIKNNYTIDSILAIIDNKDNN